MKAKPPGLDDIDRLNIAVAVVRRTRDRILEVVLNHRIVSDGHQFSSAKVRKSCTASCGRSSSATIAGLMTLFAIGLFPNLVISSSDPDLSLTIYNASSSLKTLRIMLIMALIGIPFVLAYTVSIYWIFRGKVKLDAMSY